MTGLPQFETAAELPDSAFAEISADILYLEDYREVPQEQPEALDGADMAIADEELAVTSLRQAQLNWRRDLRQIDSARRDPALFDELLEEHKPFIASLARRYYLPGGDREDLIQEGMLGFYKSVRDYNGEKSSFNTFSRLCVTRQLITAVKTANRNKHQPLNDASSLSSVPAEKDEAASLEHILPSAAQTPEETAISRETFLGLLDIFVNDLSWMEYRSLTMFLAGESYETIAEDMGIDAKSVDNALCRIRRKVSGYLSEESK